jgi:hypothetical protein
VRQYMILVGPIGQTGSGWQEVSRHRTDHTGSMGYADG